ncbi:AAA family ATPase [Desulfofundulus thermobenzoicus]|uniref:endopeptidase La n=1 Tax=Desulfofundulus thermobenzoicus TaxID=29376 RepID=A0A6N7IS04_9FIRM|nr:ATP-binding protein [Desulfofundulus thermobenzoicus]MQL52343.1 AAA family ATPase [Desulfofundulus thermobenzoicus]
MVTADTGNRLRIPADKLRRRCRPEELPWETTAQVTPLQDFIGQERAVRAMEFGLAMNAPGYNIYVAGPPGTGKSTYTQEVLTRRAARGTAPDDWCILYNFTNPDRPLAISLPPGRGQIFKRDMEELIGDLRTAIPKVFEGADYEQNKQAVLHELESQVQEALEHLRQDALQSGFAMKQGPTGFIFAPLKDGRRMSQEEFDALAPEERREIENRARMLQQKLDDMVNNGRFLEKKARERIQALEKEIAGLAIGPLVERLQEKYRDFPRVVRFLGEVAEDVTRNLDHFKTQESAPAQTPFGFPVETTDIFHRYQVNLFVNNGDTRGMPVVVENNPHYYNLFGKIEYRSFMGSLSTDFTMIKAGAIHRANGGYLVLQARDVLADPIVWDKLKKSLKNSQAVVENIGEHFRLIPTATLKPEPIPLNVKVVLIGSHYLYHLLHALDEDYQKFFKVKVDFDTEMPRTPENLEHYAAFVSSVCRRENLKHFDRSGLAELIEYGSRLAANQNKLSTRFNEVVEIIYEAAAWADMEASTNVSAPHVRRAIEERVYRSNRLEEKIQEMMVQGKILVDTAGAVVGQVNALSVLDVGDYSFGRPSRITAKTFMGQEGVVNIERETRMSGSLHTKGVLTLAGFLGSRFAQDKPLRLSARITFEQLYEGVDGDSASSAELYALLSALAELPVNQGLAVTGSVNQHGQIQPIGGVNEKIEGFFAVCRARGLTGEQGVIIPAQNLDNLMLKPEVVEAVEQNLFHIYAVKSIEEGIELLTGIPAGEKQLGGHYPEGTVFHLVDKKLRQYAEGLSSFGQQENKKEDGEQCSACGT